MAKMTSAQYVKSQNLPSLKYVADRVGKPRQTLDNWFRDSRPLFDIVVEGIKAQDND